MTTDTEPTTVVVVLEPENRAKLQTDKEALIRDFDPSLQHDIESPTQYAIVADIEARISRYLANVEPAFDEHCAAAHKVWKSACDIRARFLAAPKAMKERARRLLSDYKTREETERRERERQIAREQFEAAVQRQREEARRLAEANQPEVAAAVLAAEIETTEVTLPSAVPDVEGLTFREDWYWVPVGGDTPANRTKALSMLVRPEFLPFVSLNDSGLTQFAKRTKGTIKVPGIQFRMRQVPVRRS